MGKKCTLEEMAKILNEILAMVYHEIEKKSTDKPKIILFKVIDKNGEVRVYEKEVSKAN